MFEELAFRYMRHRKSLNMLLLAGRGMTGLPSWFPDLRSPLRSASDHSVLGTGYDEKSMSPLLSVDREHYNPSAGATPSILQPAPGEISLPGVVVDRIVAIGKRVPEDKPMRRITIKTILNWRELYLSTMRQELGDSYSEVSVEDLIRTACADSIMDHSQNKFRRCTTEDIQLYRMILENPVVCFSGDRDPTAMFGHWQWLDTLVNTNRFFVTAHGPHGLVFGDVEIGDHIFVVASCVMPLCLRRLEIQEAVKSYAPRGSAYLHGKYLSVWHRRRLTMDRRYEWRSRAFSGREERSCAHGWRF